MSLSTDEKIEKMNGNDAVAEFLFAVKENGGEATTREVRKQTDLSHSKVNYLADRLSDGGNRSVTPLRVLYIERNRSNPDSNETPPKKVRVRDEAAFKAIVKKAMQEQRKEESLQEIQEKLEDLEERVVSEDELESLRDDLLQFLKMLHDQEELRQASMKIKGQS